MREQFQNLKALIAAATSGAASKQQLTELVHLSRAIIQSYVTHFRPSAARLFADLGWTVTEAAYDLMGNAFERRADNRLAQLNNFIASLHAPLNELPPHELFLAYKSFLCKVIDAELARLYAHAEPAGAKIHRNIRLALNCDSCVFALAKDYRGYVLRPRQCDAREHLPPFPFEKLQREFLPHARSCSKIPELLCAVWEVVGSQREYRRSLPLKDIVPLFKLVYKTEEAEQAEENIPTDSLTDDELEHLLRQVEQTVQKKIVLTYLVNGKLNKREAEGAANAMHDYLWAICFSNDGYRSLYNYANRHLPMSEEEYEETLRTKMEYLWKIAKDDIAARLMKGL